MSVQTDFRWRHQPTNKMDVSLVRYLQESKIMNKSHMILVAIRSFWLPHALASKYPKNQQKLKLVASESVKVLIRQAREIIELASLSDENF